MRDKQRHTIEVHVAGICFRKIESGPQVLCLKRTDDRALFPGKWECGGGQVYRGENFEEAVKRQMKEKLGVIVDKVLPFGVYEIITPQLEQKKIPGIKFVCFWENYADGSESPDIDPESHSEFRWIAIDELGGYDFIDGIADDVQKAWKFFSTGKDPNS